MYVVGTRLQYGDGGPVQAFRTVVRLANDVTDLGILPDADIQYATVHLQTQQPNGPQNTTAMTLQPYDVALGGSASWNNIITAVRPTLLNLTQFNATTVAAPAFQVSDFTIGNDIYVDVKDIVQNWADKGSGPAAIVLIDTTTKEQEADNLFWFNTYPASVMEIGYTIPGWYTFQGNARRTGRTQYPISDTPTQKWAVTLAADYAVPYVGQLFDGSVPMTPSVVAVPDPADSIPQFPVLYTTVWWFRPWSIGNPPPLSNFSVVYGVKDLGGNNHGNVFRSSELDFEVTGTPLVVGGRVYVVGNKLDAPTTPVPKHGRMYILNAADLSLAWEDTPAHPNPVVFSGPVYNSPVYLKSPTTYRVYSGRTLSYRGNPYGAILVATTDGSDTTTRNGYLLAKDPLSGRNVWGTVDADDHLLIDGAGHLGSLPPMAFSPTYSSPCVVGDGAYIEDESCYVNARDVTDGSFRWERYQYMDTVDGSICAFDGRLYYGGEGTGHGNATAVGEADRTPIANWTTEFDPDSAVQDPLNTHYFASIWTTPAVAAENRVMVFSDDGGYVYGLNVDPVPGWDPSQISPPPVNWTLPLCRPSNATIRSSALVTGQPGQSPRAFVAADDGHIYELDTSPSPANRIIANLNLNPSGVTMRIRSSMAAFGNPTTGLGHLYVLTTRRVGTSTPIQNPTLFCIAQP